MYSAPTTQMPGPRAARPAPAGHSGRDLSPLRLDPDSTRRAQLGQIGVDLRAFERQHRVQLTPNATVVHLVVPISGAMVAVSGQEARQLTPGAALLLTKRQRTDCVWTAESAGLILHIPTALLQQSVAASFPEPRRLIAIGHAFALGAATDGLAGCLLSARRCVEDPAPRVEPAADRQLALALVGALKSADETELFPVSRSLQRASDFLMAHPDSRCSPEELASIAGVTLPTLQRNVKTCLGVPLSKFVEQVRLTWIHARLKNSMESRSIARLAEACGYRTAGTLARSYQRLFGETPTQTRARAFAARGR